MSTETTRRGFFSNVSGGVYGAALAYLLTRDLFHSSGLFAAENGEGKEERRGEDEREFFHTAVLRRWARSEKFATRKRPGFSRKNGVTCSR